MIRSLPQCDSTRLRRLLDEVLSEPEERDVLSHLDTCAACQKELELAAGDITWWEELKESLADAPAVFSMDDSTLDVEVADCRQFDAAACSYLAPSDDPRMLGRIGLYEIVGVVGRGSTGTVFKALEPSLNRYVAIKVLAPELAHNSPARKRFAREARAAAAVTHEHIVPIYAVSEFRGLPYMAMHYVAGHSLQERIDRQGPLPTAEVVRIALSTARALAAAHQQGLVHRDIKPGNILLTPGIDNALVGDFGLARVSDDASLTLSGVISGTPGYMSPEQARGELVGPQSDLFSLGSVIYAMCAGHPPFRAETTYGVIRRVCDATPRPILQLNPDVPMWLDRFTRRLLSKEPERRFRDAAEVVALLEGELAYLQNPTTIPLPQRSWMADGSERSHRWGLPVACTLLVAMLGSAWIAMPPTPDTTERSQLAASREQPSESGDATIHHQSSEDDNSLVDVETPTAKAEWNGVEIRCSAKAGSARIEAGTDRCTVVMSFGKDATHTVMIESDELLVSLDAPGLEGRKRMDVEGCVEVEIRAERDRVAVSVVERHSSSSSSSQSSSSSHNGSSNSNRSSSTSTSVNTDVKYWDIASWSGKRIELSLEGGNSIECAMDREGEHCLIELDIDDGKNERAIRLESGVVAVDGKPLETNGDYAEIVIVATKKSLRIATDGDEIGSWRGDN